jgi:hypothetical protein
MIGYCFAMLTGAVIMTGVWAFIFRKSGESLKTFIRVMCVLGLIGLILAFIWENHGLLMSLLEIVAGIICLDILFEEKVKHLFLKAKEKS